VPEAMPSVEFVAGEILFLDDGSYRWLRLQHFQCDPRSSDAALPSALLSHVRYQDSYTTADANWSPTGDTHGPYRLDRLTVDSFASIDATTETDYLRRWAEDYDGREGEGFETIIRGANDVIGDATSLWHLAEPRDSAQHEWGWILGDFREIVAINRSKDRLTLMVASAD
jgi:hypothetical protein